MRPTPSVKRRSKEIDLKGNKRKKQHPIAQRGFCGSGIFGLSQDDTSDDCIQSENDRGRAQRKHHRLWTLSEVIKLIEGVSQYGVGRWTEIKRLLFSSSAYRTSVDLKDKWINLLRASGAQLHIKNEGWRVYLQDEHGTSLEALGLMIDMSLKTKVEGSLEAARCAAFLPLLLCHGKALFQGIHASLQILKSTTLGVRAHLVSKSVKKAPDTH